MPEFNENDLELLCAKHKLQEVFVSLTELRDAEGFLKDLKSELFKHNTMEDTMKGLQEFKDAIEYTLGAVDSLHVLLHHRLGYGGE